MSSVIAIVPVSWWSPFYVRPVHCRIPGILAVIIILSPIPWYFLENRCRTYDYTYSVGLSFLCFPNLCFIFLCWRRNFSVPWISLWWLLALNLEQFWHSSDILTYAHIIIFFPTLTSRNFRVSSLTLRTLIHLELIFIQNERDKSPLWIFYV